MVKDNNTDDLNLGSSWVGGNTPDSAGIAKWDNTVTSANTTALGADLAWGSIVIADPFGLVTINAGNTLTNNGGIDMSAATQNLTLNCGYALGNSAVWNVAAGRTLTMGGLVSGSFNLTKQGGGKVILSGANTYSGVTAMTGGTLQLGAGGVIPDGVGKGDVSVGAGCTLDLNGFSETVNGLTGANSTSIVDNTAAGTTATLTVGGNDATSTFAGLIQNSGSGSTVNLIKTGTGTLTLAGANTLSGSVTVNQGNLALQHANPPGNISGLTIGGATLGCNTNNAVIPAPITLTGNLTVRVQSAGVLANLNGTLDVTGNAVINLGSSTAALAFADSNTIDWTGGTLTITGTFVSGSSLRFGTTDSGLTSDQLALISATGFTNFALNADGFLTAAGAGGYSAWAATNAGGQTADLDFDNDGVANGIEYFLVGPNGTGTGFTALPGVVKDPGTGALGVTWPKGSGYTGVYSTDFAVETSDSLTGTWMSEALAPTGTVTDSATQVKYTFPSPLGSRKFARLKVTGP